MEMAVIKKIFDLVGNLGIWSVTPTTPFSFPLDFT